MSPSTPGRPGAALAIQPNPFGDAALGSPWMQVPSDVASINDAPFRAVLMELAQMRLGAKGTSIVITGDPGSGKTHLLGRLRSSLAEDARKGVGQTTFVYVRCNASATTLWRHVRAAIATDLLKREPGGVSRLRTVLDSGPERLDSVSSLALRRVLENYGAGRHVHAASAWLRGEALAESDLNALGIGAEKDDEERSRESEARDAVNGLLEFLSPDPMVLCFDQVEALETYRGDRDGFLAMGKLVSSLSDGHRHVLLVSCIISAFELAIDEFTNGADRDRWVQKKVNLRPIDKNQAIELVKARLDSSPFLAEDRARHATEPLWPLNERDLDPLFEKTGLCLPRTLIQECKRQFEILFRDEQPQEAATDDFLQQEYARCFGNANRAVKSQGGDKTLSDHLPWLMQESGFAPLGADADRSRFGADLAFRGPSGGFAVVPCYCGGVSLYARLRRVERHWNPRALGLRIVRDASIRPGAKSQELLDTLKARGAKEIFPLPEALNALHAIRDMLASARSGDLNHNGVRFSEQAVTEWSLANLPPQLETLRAGLQGDSVPREPEAGDPTLPRLTSLLRERKILKGEVAAKELSVTLEEISACARRNPMRFGVLAGPPMVLFEAVEGSPREDLHA